LDWLSSTLQSKIKGRGGRRFLAPVPESAGSGTQAITDQLSPESITQTLLKTPASVTLPLDEAHHAMKVLRLKDGELVSVFDKEKQIEGLGILHFEDDKAVAEIHVLRKSTKKPPALLIGMPKTKTAESLVEKASEIGASTLIFFIAEHSIQKKHSVKEHLARKERFEKIRDSAIKQSYAQYAPEVSIYNTLEDALGAPGFTSFHPNYLCEPSYYIHVEDEIIKNAPPPLPLLNAITSQANTHTPLIAIGPEGGFSRLEQRTLLSNGFSLLSLGENVLRVDTAAILALAVFGAASTDG
jgi:16S rRNA (uracil1498-N3)-methyltransferase